MSDSEQKLIKIDQNVNNLMMTVERQLKMTQTKLADKKVKQKMKTIER